jgi:hypothetical protein
VYRLEYTEQYRDDLQALGADLERVEAELTSTVYFALRRHPEQGFELADTDLRILRRRLFMGLGLVSVYYRFDPLRRITELVSIELIDTGVL